MTQEKNFGEWQLPETCVTCGAEGTYRRERDCVEKTFRGEKFTIKHHRWRCTSCHNAILGDREIDETMRALVEAYQSAHGLLTAKEICEKRKARNWTQPDLADRSELGVATIKRLEGGCVVQTKVNDTALRDAFNKAEDCDWTIVVNFDSVKIRYSSSNEKVPTVVFHQRYTVDLNADKINV